MSFLSKAGAFISAAVITASCTSMTIREDRIMTDNNAISASAPVSVSASPLISRNVPAYSGTNPATASAGNDEHYFSFWSGTAPDYLAYDLSGVPEEQRKEVSAVWYTTSTFDRIGQYVNQNMIPTDYNVEVNAAPGGTYPTEGWVTVEEVRGKTYGSMMHTFDMTGYNWIRLNVLKADGEEGRNISLNLDVHSGKADTWLFLGDSITAGGMNNCYGTGFATYLNQIDAGFFPVQINGGIGGITSTDGIQNIDKWLSDCPARFVSIAYGTNDCWGNPGNADNFYNNTKAMIDKILEAGRIPVLPKIPGSTNADVGNNVPLFNAKIEQLWSEYEGRLIKGPDFEAFFNEHPEGLSGDGVHPSSEGYDMMRQVWAQEMYKAVYENGAAQTEPVTEAPETQPITEAPKPVTYGDANTDGHIDVSDAVAVLQYVANQEKYPLTEEGLVSADIDGQPGITGSDAITIQKIDAGIIKLEDLPLK